MNIKVNDKVKILSGKDRGKTGKVIQVFPENSRVVVEGVNLTKKNMRPRKMGEKGQIIELAGPLSLSKVMILCPKCGRAVRMAKKIEAGKNKRVCRACKEIID